MTFHVLWIAVLILCEAASGFARTNEAFDYSSIVQRAEAEYRSGHLAPAEGLFLNALQLVEKSDTQKRAAVLTYLGNIYLSRDDLADASAAYSEALAIYKRHSNRQETIVALRNLGATYSLARRDKDAFRVLREALALTNDRTSTDSAITSVVLNSTGVLYFYKGDMRRAEAFFDRALKLIVAKDSRCDLSEVLGNLGAIYTNQRKYKQAEQFLEQALEIRRSEAGDAHPDLSLTLNLLGDLYTQSGRYDKSEAKYQQAIQLLKPYGLQFEARIARLLWALSRTYNAEGHMADSDRALADAAAIAVRNLTKPYMSEIAWAQSIKLDKNGNTKQADELRMRIREAQMVASLVVVAKGSF